MASRKMKNVPFYNGKLVIICEGIDSFKNKNNEIEHPIKFWFPD